MARVVKALVILGVLAMLGQASPSWPVDLGFFQFVSQKCDLGDNSAESIHVVSPNGSGSSCRAANPGSLSATNQLARAGDIILLKPGVYGQAIDPSQSGSASLGHITYLGEPGAIVRATVDLGNTSYIRLDGIRFESTNGLEWIRSDPGSSNIEILNSEFDATGIAAYRGIDIDGTYTTIRGNTFESWHDGNAIDIIGDYVLIESNDFKGAEAGHGLFGIHAQYVVIRSNYFQNTWDRVGFVEWRETASETWRGENYLFEDNIIFGSDWDGSNPASGTDGSTALIKFNVSMGIFRNNIIAGSEQRRTAPVVLAVHRWYDLHEFGRSPRILGLWAVIPRKLAAVT